VTTPVPWHDFSSDPRRPESAPLRAADRDRAVVLAALGDAYADGRLTKEEYDERATAATAAKTLGDLPPLLADLVPIAPGAPGTALDRATVESLDAQALRHWEKQRSEALNGLLFIAVVTWVIWLVTSGVGSFPWPVFPTLFVGMRLVQVQVQKREIIRSQREKLEAKERKRLDRRERPALSPGDDSDAPDDTGNGEDRDG
jgi:uncharacterized protein DUF1707